MHNSIDRFYGTVKASGSNMMAVAVDQKGAVEARSFYPHNRCQNIYSVSKVFVVTAIGILSDRGLLSVDEKVTDILGDLCPADTHPYWQETTVRMLLLHRIGLPGGYLDIDCQDANTFGEDYIAYTLRGPWSCPPDTEEHYTDAAFYLLSVIAELRAGMALDNFLWEELFLPLGFREAAWSHCPKGHAMGATGLYIRPEDMIKLGRLYLDGGLWKGERILSQRWVDEVLREGYELRPVHGGQGHAKGGMYEQMLLLIPSTDTVVGWHSFEDHQPLDVVKTALECFA